MCITRDTRCGDDSEIADSESWGQRFVPWSGVIHPSHRFGIPNFPMSKDEYSNAGQYYMIQMRMAFINKCVRQAYRNQYRISSA